MKTTIITLTMAFIGLQSCVTDEPVKFSAIDSHMPFADEIKEIELIPLSTDKVNMLRTEIFCKNGNCIIPDYTVHSQGPELIVAEDSYILVDPEQDRIYRYSLDGKFMNAIGVIEEGKEFLRNAQLRNGGLYTYIYPNAVRFYKLDGTLVESEVVGDVGQGGWKVNDGILTWYGFGSGRPGRIALWEGQDSTSFLPTDEKVLNLELKLPIFNQNKDYVTFIDGNRSSVMKYCDGKISSHQEIDLGTYAINDSYYTHDDWMSAAMEMMSKPFGIVERYVEGGKEIFMEVFVQTPEGGTHDYYGIFNNNRWIWFSPGTTNEHPFVNSFRTIKGKTLYCILNPDILKNIQEELKVKITTPLESIPKDFIIAKVHLK